LYKLLSIPVMLLALQACAGIAYQSRGVAFATLYADNVTPVLATQNPIGPKKGESCSTSILGLVTTGDASIRAAADAGGINAVSAVDQSYTNILGLFATYCVIVSGSPGGGGGGGGGDMGGDGGM
jgi:hypothetical protein